MFISAGSRGGRGRRIPKTVVAQPTVQTFAASGTWTKPPGCKRIRVRAVGDAAVTR